MTDETHECPHEGCGETFDTPHSLGGHVQGSHNSEKNKIEVTCEWCDDSFEVYPSVAENRRFCSRECTDKWKTTHTAERNPNWSPHVEIECDWCGDVFEVQPHRADEARFCDQDCMGKWISRNMVGKDAGAWQGGYEPYYGPNWREQRRRARKRDNHECQACGKTQEENGRELDVHHITPFREFVDDDGNADYEAANDLDNLVSLCQSCHREYEGLPVVPRTAN